MRRCPSSTHRTSTVQYLALSQRDRDKIHRALAYKYSKQQRGFEVPCFVGHNNIESADTVDLSRDLISGTIHKKRTTFFTRRSNHSFASNTPSPLFVEPQSKVRLQRFIPSDNISFGFDGLRSAQSTTSSEASAMIRHW